MVTRVMGELTPEELEQRAAFLKTMPMMPPEDIANAVLELVRDDSLNGVAMAVTFGRPPRLVDQPFRFRSDPAQSQ
jgi:hypothetical protein